MSHLNCWVILERKAHDQVRDLQKDLATTQAKTEQLQATLDKLTGMYAEYQAAEEAGGKSMGLSGSMNQRQFMSQLLTLRERIERDLAHQQGLMAQQRTRLIRAEAERERQIIIAEAYKDAQRVKGEGDQKAAAIYAKAFGDNPEFYAFYRSLEGYRAGFAKKNDVLVLEPNSDFFKYFKSPGKGSK